MRIMAAPHTDGTVTVGAQLRWGAPPPPPETPVAAATPPVCASPRVAVALARASVPGSSAGAPPYRRCPFARRICADSQEGNRTRPAAIRDHPCDPEREWRHSLPRGARPTTPAAVPPGGSLLVIG